MIQYIYNRRKRIHEKMEIVRTLSLADLALIRWQFQLGLDYKTITNNLK